MKSICLFAFHFGKWPCWFDMFLESARHNTTVDWYIATDCPIPENAPANIRFARQEFSDYCDMASEKLGIRFQPEIPYNICNLRPMYGEIYEAEIEGYDYFGWTDTDVIYGDIRSFYTDNVLSHNVISTNYGTCTGHFMLLKNEPWLKTAYKHISGWRERLECPGTFDWAECLDEAHLSALLSPDESIRIRLGTLTGTHAPDQIFYSNNYFCQQWSTPFIPGTWLDGSRTYPETWYWRNGTLTNDRDGARQFLYLHLMNFKAPRWVDAELYGQSPTWQDLEDCMSFTIDQLHDRPPAERSVMINRTGIHLER